MPDLPFFGLKIPKKREESSFFASSRSRFSLFYAFHRWKPLRKGSKRLHFFIFQYLSRDALPSPEAGNSFQSPETNQHRAIQV